MKSKTEQKLDILRSKSVDEIFVKLPFELEESYDIYERISWNPDDLHFYK